jgi:hypothetical protein
MKHAFTPLTPHANKQQVQQFNFNNLCNSTPHADSTASEAVPDKINEPCPGCTARTGSNSSRTANGPIFVVHHKSKSSSACAAAQQQQPTPLSKITKP